MTGYAYKETETEGSQISVEIKSVNNRFLDLSVNLPSFLNPLEQRIRKLVSEKILRGKVDLTVRVRDLSSNTSVTADTKAAAAYYKALVEVAEAIGKSSDDVSLGLVAKQEGVLQAARETDAEDYWNKICGILNEVLETFISDRAREGANLKKDLLLKLDTLDKCAAFFKEWQPKMETKFREQITKRFTELLGDQVDQNRIMTEVAAMLVRYTINEEIVRLHSHLAALRKEFEAAAPGKRIDFICQEANREINTIGSKNQFEEVGREVINAKDALENIREQSKNVE